MRSSLITMVAIVLCSFTSQLANGQLTCCRPIFHECWQPITHDHCCPPIVHPIFIEPHCCQKYCCHEHCCHNHCCQKPITPEPCDQAVSYTGPLGVLYIDGETGFSAMEHQKQMRHHNLEEWQADLAFFYYREDFKLFHPKDPPPPPIQFYWAISRLPDNCGNYKVFFAQTGGSWQFVQNASRRCVNSDARPVDPLGSHSVKLENTKSESVVTDRSDNQLRLTSIAFAITEKSKQLQLDMAEHTTIESIDPVSLTGEHVLKPKAVRRSIRANYHVPKVVRFPADSLLERTVGEFSIAQLP